MYIRLIDIYVAVFRIPSKYIFEVLLISVHIKLSENILELVIIFTNSNSKAVTSLCGSVFGMTDLTTAPLLLCTKTKMCKYL